MDGERGDSEAIYRLLSLRIRRVAGEDLPSTVSEVIEPQGWRREQLHWDLL
jgi:hypothetical protein